MQRRRTDAEADREDVVGAIEFSQSSPDDLGVKSKKVGKPRSRKTRRNDDNNNNTGFVIKFSILMMIVLVASYFLVAHHEEMQLEHLRQNIIHDELEPLSREWEEKYAKLEEENEQLKRGAKTYDNLKAESDRLKGQLNQQQEVREKLETKIGQLEKYKAKMQENIQLMSKTALIEKFGPGPHYVEISVAFDPSFPKAKDTDGDTGRIKIQLADINEMPHVVYWFLEQVTRKLYDGCSFHRNAGHVIQAGPAPNFLSPPNPQLAKHFKDSGFYSVLFQEYSSKYPHEKYTLGFAGRPGGPDFYVSTQDNTKIHGPGGQTSYEDPTEADPCFAKVVEGFEVVDRIQMSPVKPGGYRAMEKNVAIVSMILLDESKQQSEI